METMSAQQFCLRWNNHRSNLLNVFDELLQSEAFTDVTIVVEGSSAIRCHKIILAACSLYFQHIFRDLPNEHLVIILKGVKYSEIKAILEYVYRGEVNVAQDQLAALLRVAEDLKVKGLVEERRPPDQHKEEGQQNSPSNISSTIKSTQSSSTNSSPTHSNNGMPVTKHPYGIYDKSNLESCSSRPNLPIWTGSSLPHQSYVPDQNQAAMAAMLRSHKAHTEKRHYPNLLTNPSNRDTPILRTVLGQNQEQQPVSLVCHNNNYENFSSLRQEQEGEKQPPNEPHETNQPYEYQAHPPEEEEDKTYSLSPHPYSNEIPTYSPNLTSYVPPQKWKRYKQYSRNDITLAINAVICQGMSALQASRKYKVPSRTLYDKVKKLGGSAGRSFRRNSNGNFPPGRNGNSPHGGENLSEPDEPFVNARSFQEEQMPSSSRQMRSPSPGSSFMMRYMQYTGGGGPNLGASVSATQSKVEGDSNGVFKREKEDDDDEGQVEDLSVGKKQEGVIVSPNCPKSESTSDANQEEVSVNDSIKSEEVLNNLC